MSEEPASFDRPGMKQAIAASERNLRLQLAVNPERRKGTVHSFASNPHPNVRMWKYRWRIFVSPPEGHIPNLKRWTVAMPLMSHADFDRTLAWMQEHRIECHIHNVRQRREHPVWNAKVVAEEELAPPYDEDPDEIGSHGHR